MSEILTLFILCLFKSIYSDFVVFLHSDVISYFRVNIFVLISVFFQFFFEKFNFHYQTP